MLRLRKCWENFGNMYESSRVFTSKNEAFRVVSGFSWLQRGRGGLSRGSGMRRDVTSVSRFSKSIFSRGRFPRRVYSVISQTLVRCYLARNYAPLSRIHVYLRSTAHIRNDSVLSALHPFPPSVVLSRLIIPRALFSRETKKQSERTGARSTDSRSNFPSHSSGLNVF